MKVKEGYILRTVANQHIVMPTGSEAVDFNGLIHLNDSGKLLFETLQIGATKAELIQKLLDTYKVDQATATKDVESFLTILKDKDVLETS